MVNELERLKKMLPLVKKLNAKLRDGCCSFNKNFTVMDVVLKKIISFFLFLARKAFFWLACLKNVHLPLHRKTRKISETTTHIREFQKTNLQQATPKPHFPYMYYILYT